MLYRIRYWLSIYFMLLSVLQIKAQGDSLALCNGCLCENDPTPAGVMISHVHPKGEWMFSYRFMQMNMGSMHKGTEKVSDQSVFEQYLMSSDRMRMDMHMLMAMYGVTNRLTVMVMANYIRNSMQMKMLEGSEHKHGNSQAAMDMDLRTQGISDLKLTALYGLLDQNGHRLLVGAGISIPTGSVQQIGARNSMYPGQRLPYAMQTGSGTWDLNPALSYTYQTMHLSFTTQLTSVIRTGLNQAGYSLGNEWSTSNWVAWQWSRHFSTSARVEALTTGAIYGKDNTLYAGYEPAANPANYGGQRLSAYLGTNVYFISGWLKNSKLGGEYGLPLYQSVNGPQMITTSAWTLSWSYFIN